MNAGMLWLQVDMKKPLKERIAEAVEYYRRKYGEADVVFANPKILEGHEVIVQGIEVKPMRCMPIAQLWIGVEDAARGVERRSAELLKQMEMSL